MTMTYVRRSLPVVGVALSLGLTVACGPKDGDTETNEASGTEGDGTGTEGADGMSAEGGDNDGGGTSGNEGTSGTDDGGTSGDGDGDGDGDLCEPFVAKLVECGLIAESEAAAEQADCEASITEAYADSTACGDAIVALLTCYFGLECAEFESYYVCEAEGYALESACYGGEEYGDYGDYGDYDGTGLDTGFDTGVSETGEPDTGNPGTGGGPTGGPGTGGGPTGG